MPGDRYFQPEIETMPRAGLTKLQTERILELVPYAYERSPFYREMWDAAGVRPADIRNLDDFTQRIPTITRDDIRAFRARTGDPFGGLLCVEPAELTSITSSSGTTNDPEFFPEMWDAQPPLPLASARDLWELGLRPGDRVLTPAGSFRGFFDGLYQMLGLIPLYVDTWMGNWAEVLDAIREHRPAYVQLLGPIIIELERLAARHDLRELFSCFKGASFAGQPLAPRQARMVREQWGLELFVYTSAGDTGTAWECREHDGYHLWEDMVFAEHLATDGQHLVPGGDVGELVATSLDDDAAPLIRYRSEDLVRMTKGPCGCGRTHSRMWVAGRKGDETVVRGRPVVIGDVWAAVESIPETADGLFQIIRRGREVDELRIRVGYEPPGDVAGLAGRLANAIEERVGVLPEILLETVEEILARSSSVAKFPRVVAR
ncbi:MAG: phenylacetate--CoA ligase family protein [Streptosporangiaceae bacterium]|nr:phenylacetate--CoA ligase family protein [Streptosporangiaceae bacterium]MBV9855457.1 phenylacetate--CoA ligase family protein [Streptosporangiaceae bacterium]